MNVPASASRDDSVARITGVALVGVAVAWLVVAGMIAVVIRLQVPNPAELLRDVADQRAVWITANAVLIVQQAVLILGFPALTERVDVSAAGALRGLLAITGGSLVASGVFHGVFGAHLASKVTDGVLPEALRLDAELVHALADTCWFVGVGAMTAATALVSISVWKQESLLARVGLASVAFNVLQFGWFFEHAFGMLAAPGTALQAIWFVVAGSSWARRTSSDTGRGI